MEELSLQERPFEKLCFTLERMTQIKFVKFISCVNYLSLHFFLTHIQICQRREIENI